jgi:ABC-type uncharacterized transport system permease subunit
MNWKAFFAIGVVTIIPGAVLLIPGLIWARRKAKQHHDVPAGMSVTKIGYLYLGIVLLVLFAGLTSQYWAAGSSLGNFTATRFGRFLFGGIVVGAALLFERHLAAAGIEIKVLVKRE